MLTLLVWLLNCCVPIELLLTNKPQFRRNRYHNVKHLKILYLALHLWTEKIMNLGSSSSFLPFSLSPCRLLFLCHATSVWFLYSFFLSKYLIKILEFNKLKTKKTFEPGRKLTVLKGTYKCGSWLENWNHLYKIKNIST